MAYKFPEKLTLKFVSANEKKPISGLIVLVALKAKHKNNYSLKPLITGNNGEVVIFKPDAIKAITKEHAESPMDYAGTIDDVFTLKIILENEQTLRERSGSISRYYPEDAELLNRLIDTANNSSILNIEKDVNLSNTISEVEFDVFNS